MAKTILIVDDSSSLRTVVEVALERAGYDVLEAGVGCGSPVRAERPLAAGTDAGR